MSTEGISVTVILAGSVMLLVGAGRGSRARADVPAGRWQRWFAYGGLALLSIGMWIRIASLSPPVGACPGSSAAADAGSVPAHCFHGAPWPPRGSSR